MNKLKELRDKYATALNSAVEIRKPYEGKTGNMTDEELSRYDAFLSEAFGLKDQIERLEKEESLTAWGKTVVDKIAFNATPVEGASAKDVEKFAKLRSEAYRQVLTNREYAQTPEYRSYLREMDGAPEAIRNAYQFDNPAGGGFAAMPQEMVGEIITLLKDKVWMRGLATGFTVAKAESLGAAALDTEPSDTDWTNELNTGNEETTAAFGKRELKPSPLAKRAKLSKTLVRRIPNAVEVILDRLAYKKAITEEKAFLLGNGANQPLGVFTASANGISTARDFACAGATSFAGDDFIGAYYTLKAAYRERARWILHRTIIMAARKLKDSSNNYLWQPGLNTFVAQGTSLIGRQPDTLMGCPIMETEYAPNTQTTGLYVGMLGDFSHYWIADALDMEIQVLFELYAATNQNGYILRSETDGMPVLEEAFVRMKQA